jgi:cyclohexanone monooxygenase
VVGTGSSGIQVIPELARRAEHLWVFQRTPNFSLPARNGRPLVSFDRLDEHVEYRQSGRRTPGGASPRMQPRWASGHDAPEDERTEEFERRWQFGGTSLLQTYRDMMRDEAVNEYAADFVRKKIAETVNDAAVARTLMPEGYPIGAKRICVDTDYYESFNRANVTLVQVRDDPIEAVTPHGIRTSRAQYDLDVIVFATGYDAMTGPLLGIDIRGRGGRSLRTEWGDGPRTYLGVAVAGFPNVFVVAGVGSPSVRVNMVAAIEQHAEWITRAIADLARAGYSEIEAQADAEEEWTRHVAEVAETTLFTRANSWYLGANIEGKPRVFMPYLGPLNEYAERCEDIAADGYRGFTRHVGGTRRKGGDDT